MVQIKRVAVAGLLVIGACAEPSVSPSARVTGAPGAASTMPAAQAAEPVLSSAALAAMNDRLAPSGVEISKAELLVDAEGWQAATLIIANNRTHTTASEFVNRDPRRGGHPGLTYAVASGLGGKVPPLTRDPDGSNVRPVPQAQVDAQIEEAIASWRDEQCSDAPLVRVPVPAGVDPDLVDNLFLGTPLVNYARVADVVQGGWLSPSFFTALAGPVIGPRIIGVTFTFVFVANGEPTDVDRNGKGDVAFTEIFYNSRFAWGSNLAFNVIDFYSIIAHETGHALGLGHFGKVFVNTKDITPGGIPLSAVKFAPKALMNAVYITGRSQIEGTDRASFCQIWASKN